MLKIVLASNNPGKLKEFSELLKPFQIEIVPQTDAGIPKAAEETGLTFIENAIIKAREASRLSGMPAIGDDSGLVVDALSGAPGIYSARYAGASATAQDNIKKLLKDLKGVPLEKRGAHFHCSLVFMMHDKDPTPLVSEGRWDGRITKTPKGVSGFGYDPVFYVPSERKTAAQLPLDVKNRISHRGIALQLLANLLSEKL